MFLASSPVKNHCPFLTIALQKAQTHLVKQMGRTTSKWLVSVYIRCGFWPSNRKEALGEPWLRVLTWAAPGCGCSKLCVWAGAWQSLKLGCISDSLEQESGSWSERGLLDCLGYLCLASLLFHNCTETKQSKIKQNNNNKHTHTHRKHTISFE